MPGCGMYSRPNLAGKARYNSLLKKAGNNKYFLAYNLISSSLYLYIALIFCITALISVILLLSFIHFFVYLGL